MGIKSIRRTQEEFINDVKKAVGDEYTVIGEYINTDTKVLMVHNICGKEFEVRPYLFLGKISTRCPHCNGNKKRTTEDFIQLVYQLSKDEYSVLGSYKNTDTPILMKHNICNLEFNMRPSCFKRGQRCPHCARSVGAEKIQMYLEENNISYIPEKTYPDLVDSRALRFDFYLDELNVLIEYDGEQHFRKKSFGGNDDKSEYEFMQLKKHDKMKNEYCMKNKIKLIRIPYWNFKNIETILNNKLNN